MAATKTLDAGDLMIPLPEVIEYLDDVPSEFLSSAFAALREAPDPARRPPLIETLQPSAEQALPSNNLLLLGRFSELMAERGWPVQVARMLFDRLYAFEQLALAHGSNDQVLQSLALELFKSYQGGAPRLRPSH